MKILLDQGTPVPIRHALVGHLVSTAFEQGWSNLENGMLLREAEASGFDVLITTDQNLKYQQNLLGRKIAIVVLMTTSWPIIQKYQGRVAAALSALMPGQYIEVEFGN